MNLLPFNDPLPDEPAATAPRGSAERHSTPVNLPELLTIRELAKALKLSPRSIWRLVRNRQLPLPIRIGGSIRWRAEDISRWIAQGCNGTSGSSADVPTDSTVAVRDNLANTKGTNP